MPALFIPPKPILAPYATDPAQSKGRLYKEAESPMRTAFQRDRDRIVHCVAFRRLEYKTQVFVNHEGDHYRTRLTHSLEVAQIARAISRALGLCEDLAEALALAHDLGHTPFGHAGEDALDEAMAEFGGFDHNAQTIKILTKLESRYAGFDGLNLSWETLEGIAKHNGPLEQPIPRAIAEYSAKHDLALNQYSSAEAQVAALADDIAYNNHDMDDGLRARLFTMEALEDIPIVGQIFKEMMERHKGMVKRRITHEALRRIIDRMVVDVLTETKRNIEQLGIETAEDIRHLNQPVVAFSEEMQECNRLLKSFLMKNMYQHYRVNRMTSKAGRVVKELFAFFYENPGCLMGKWRNQVERLKEKGNFSGAAEVVGNYIAGMTDRFALQEHRTLFRLTGWIDNR